MNFLSKLVSPLRRAEKNFHRARAAELRAAFAKAEEYFQAAATAYDEHFADKGEHTARPSQLVMAGISYVRIGRNNDALRTLEACIRMKEIPDAFLHAGYAAAKMNDLPKTVNFWSSYPTWYEQRIMHDALNQQLNQLRTDDTPDMQAACAAVAQAYREQDKENENRKRFKRGKQDYPPNRGY